MRQVVVAAVLAAAVFGGSVSAFAQETPLITVARKQTQGLDIRTAPSPITAEMLPVGDEYVWIAADIQAVDRTDPALSFYLRLFVSPDGGLSFPAKPDLAFYWKGHADNPSSGAIGSAMPAATFVGKVIRVELDVPVRMAIGFSATITRVLPE